MWAIIKEKIGAVVLGAWLLVWFYIIFKVFTFIDCMDTDNFLVGVVSCVSLGMSSIAIGGLIAWLPVIILLFTLAIPIAGLNLLYGAIFDSSETDRGFTFCLGIGLLAVSYWYSTRVIPVLISDLLPWVMKLIF